MSTVSTETRILTEKEKQQLETVLPMWKIVAIQFFEHRMAVAGLFVILSFIAIALLAPVIKNMTGINPEAQNPLKRYLPPMSRAALPTEQRETYVMQFESFSPEKAVSLKTDLVAKGIATPETESDAIYELSRRELPEIQQTLGSIHTPAAEEFLNISKNFETLHILGTDELGRDAMLRLIYGARVSMGVGIMVAIFSALVGLFDRIYRRILRRMD